MGRCGDFPNVGLDVFARVGLGPGASSRLGPGGRCSVGTEERCMERHRIRMAVPVFSLVCAVSVLSGCYAGPSGGSQTTLEQGSSSSPTDGVTAPTLRPEGSAAESRELFDSANRGVIERRDAPARQDFVAGLVAAGFERDAIEATRDVTTLGNEAESVQIAVRWGDECLVAQYDPPDGGYTSTVADTLSSGHCLLGDTPRTQS